MIRTLGAALITVSLMVAPGLSSSANAAQGTTRHAVTFDKRHKHAAPVRHHRQYGVTTRHGKIVKRHRPSHVAPAAR